MATKGKTRTKRSGYHKLIQFLEERGGGDLADVPIRVEMLDGEPHNYFCSHTPVSATTTVVSLRPQSSSSPSSRATTSRILVLSRYATVPMRAAAVGWGLGNAASSIESDGTAVLRMPAWALSWVCRRVPPRATVQVVVEADEQLAEAAAAIWDPRHDGPLSRLWEAFEAAKALTGDS